MCENISSHISSLQVEQDDARSLIVGVRPSSSLQQAPWWVKIPKHFTWLNLPDGVNDDQRQKDFAKMGIEDQYSDSLGIRTPSPDFLIPRKRKKRHYDQHENNNKRHRPDYSQADYFPPYEFDNR